MARLDHGTFALLSNHTGSLSPDFQFEEIKGPHSKRVSDSLGPFAFRKQRPKGKSWRSSSISPFARLKSIPGGGTLVTPGVAAGLGLNRVPGWHFGHRRPKPYVNTAGTETSGQIGIHKLPSFASLPAK